MRERQRKPCAFFVGAPHPTYPIEKTYGEFNSFRVCYRGSLSAVAWKTAVRISGFKGHSGTRSLKDDPLTWGALEDYPPESKMN